MTRNDRMWWRIRDGAVVRRTRDGRDELVDARNRMFATVPQEFAPHLRRIGTQVDIDRIPATILEQLQADGYIVPSSEPSDPYMVDVLRAYDREFLWIASVFPRELYDYVLRLHGSRKVFSADLFQGPCLPETTLRRALMLWQRHGRNPILLLGDDDLVSVPLAILGGNVTVIDLDVHLLAFLDARAEEKGVGVRTITHDLRQPLPEFLRGQFAAVAADPVSAESWLRVWLSRAASALKPDGTFYLTTYKRSEELTRTLIEDAGLREEAMWRGFSHYYNVYLHYVGSLDSNLFVIGPSTRSWELVSDVDESKRNSGSFLPFPTREYTLDFYGCHPARGWTESVALLEQEARKFAKGEDVVSTSTKHGAYSCIYVSMQDKVITALVCPERGYVGLDLHEPAEFSLHEEFVALINRIFAPSKFRDDELYRYVLYP